MKKNLFRKELTFIKTVVVKTGSRILTAAGHEQRVKRLVEDLVTLQKAGLRTILVSSGAIAHGMSALGLTKRPTTIPLQQACASIGQNKLMQIYENFFSMHGVVIGQVLLTWDDLRSKKRYLNLRNTFFQLLDCGAIPIVNENDSVGVEEIRFGNNDVLAAQVALLTQADLFVNLTDVGGLYDKNPHTDKTAKHIPVVSEFSSSVHKLANEKQSEISVGGMSTKLKAAEIVTKAGIFALVGDGFDQRLTDLLIRDDTSTLFLPQEHKMSSRHRWIAFSGQSAGAVTIDDGALKAVKNLGKSLLPAGIKEVRGSFKSGDMVDISTADGVVLARGLVNYSAEEISMIMGSKSSEIKNILGKKDFDEIVHRDNLVLL
ncbi:MAG TPA: glutamate 5-kinase [Chitinispirillaceae bacterium]|nr:glutamate 5-kinase [Chitinispirillaceae bacterium]